jgi:hypothetical protein
MYESYPLLHSPTKYTLRTLVEESPRRCTLDMLTLVGTSSFFSFPVPQCSTSNPGSGSSFCTATTLTSLACGVSRGFAHFKHPATANKGANGVSLATTAATLPGAPLPSASSSSLLARNRLPPCICSKDSLLSPINRIYASVCPPPTYIQRRQPLAIARPAPRPLTSTVANPVASTSFTNRGVD